ncbi:hypothetical protein [Celerinatantimonas sp. MCCC 1A17872]|uniref:hypothetical protein n=1 Tax=Celerinatantimonas sp. MCCC 1A17872 TaxID=3177514 RepID=UPI0038C1EB15
MRSILLPPFIVASGAMMLLNANLAKAAPTASHNTLLKAIVLNMGKDGATVTDARYNNLFESHNATSGVAAAIRSGQFFINGLPIPATAAAFKKSSPAGYLVNQVPWLRYDASKHQWQGGYKAEQPATSYAAAALATADGIVAGLEVRLYDTNDDGYTDRIDADYKEGVLVNRIKHNSDNTYSVYRQVFDTKNKTAAEGRLYDGKHFTLTSGEKIKAANFDRRIASQDVALFWYGPQGWVMQRAKQVQGPFLGRADHKNYTIGTVTYQDAMRFSRDNIPVSNRPGEFANAENYFGLDKDTAHKVNLWLVPTTSAQTQGGPIAITRGMSAKVFLSKAISVAQARLNSVVVSQDGHDVPAQQHWVNQAAYSQLSNAIKSAKAALHARQSSDSQLDYQLYLLYLNLDGSSNDIGAKFGGFSYTGFEHQIKPGLQGNSH